MLELGQPQPGERALDVATGTGAVLFALAEAVAPTGRAAGIDFTPAMLAQATQRRASFAHPNRVALIAAHAGHLPFKVGRFDLVTCRFSVHHMSDPAAGLAAMAGALRPGGRLVICDFVLPADSRAAASYDRLERLRGHHYVEIYTRPRLVNLLAAAGCPVTQTRTVERETDPQELLQLPSLTSEARQEIATVLDQLSQTPSDDFAIRRHNGAIRLVRQDAVLLGTKH
jgi:SAM-dependent methyltransferase